jgi:hypothetical protein
MRRLYLDVLTQCSNLLQEVELSPDIRAHLAQEEADLERDLHKPVRRKKGRARPATVAVAD